MMNIIFSYEGVLEYLSKKRVVDIVKDLLNPYLEENGYELFDIEYQKEGKDWFLRVYIDKEEGISIDDCEKVTRFLSPKLDEADPINKNYFLEVSSPGIDRPLIQDSDYEKYKGEIIDIFLYKTIDSKKVISGELVGLEGDQIIIKDETKNEIKVPKTFASKVKLAVIF